MDFFFKVLLLDEVLGDGNLLEDTIGGLGVFILFALIVLGLYKSNKYIDTHLVKYLPLFLILAIVFTVILVKTRDFPFIGVILAFANILNGYVIMISVYHFINAGGGGLLSLVYINTLEPLADYLEKSNGILPILNIPIAFTGIVGFILDYTLVPICTIPAIQKIAQIKFIK